MSLHQDQNATHSGRLQVCNWLHRNPNQSCIPETGGGRVDSGAFCFTADIVNKFVPYYLALKSSPLNFFFLVIFTA